MDIGEIRARIAPYGPNETFIQGTRFGVLERTTGVCINQVGVSDELERLRMALNRRQAAKGYALVRDEVLEVIDESVQ
jgi:hypothetical protein